MDGIVAEIQADFLKREVGECDLLAENVVAVAVVASEHRRVLVEINREFPELKFFARNALVMTLRQSDFVKKPISAACVGNVFCAVGEKYAAVDAVAIPLLGACELPQLVLGQCFRGRHDVVFLSVLVASM